MVGTGVWKLKAEAALQADRLLRGAAADGLRVDKGRLHTHTQFGSDVEVGEFCINIGIDYLEQIDADKGEDAEVTVASLGIFALAQGFGELGFRDAVQVARGEQVGDA